MHVRMCVLHVYAYECVYVYVCVCVRTRVCVCVNCHLSVMPKLLLSLQQT